MEEIITTTTYNLLEILRLEGNFSLTPELKNKLLELSPSTIITAYGTVRFRLADEYPFYYITDFIKL